MKLFKRFASQEKRKVEAFKQILKYGDDIYKLYNDTREKSKKLYEEIVLAEDKIKDVIAKQLKIKLKTQTIGNWNTVYIRDYDNCSKSPIGVCVTMLEYGSLNPLKDIPTNCFYCGKKYK